MFLHRDATVTSDEYARLMAPARDRFALSGSLQVLQSRTDEVFLEAFLLHFCSLGSQMTQPVERWIARAAERCAEIGLQGIARALTTHAKAEAGHHLMMIADVASLTDRWNTLRHPPMSADDLLRQPPSAGVLQYCRVHEDNIAGATPYAQIAIEYEIEMLPLRFGELFITRCIEVLGPEIMPCLSFVTEHIELDVAHTKLNAALLTEVLQRDPGSISALVSAGTAALNAYAAFLADCVSLAEEESHKLHRPISVSTPSSAVSWIVRSPLEEVAHGINDIASSGIEELRSLRGFALFDNGRRPYFQTQDGAFVDDDPVDAHAHHILAYSGGGLVGCIRVYCPGTDGPPCVAETLLGRQAFMLMLGKLGVQRSNIVEIGRWAVHPNYRLLGSLAVQLAAGSAALANTLRYASEMPREIVMCSVGTIERQDAMLSCIGLTTVPDVDQIYCSKYNDNVRIFFCSAIGDLSPWFRRLMREMVTTLSLPRETRIGYSARDRIRPC